MSRVGRSLIKLPKGVDVKLDKQTVKVHGPKGELSIDMPYFLAIKNENEQLEVVRKGDSKREKSSHGLIRMLIHNMVYGVSSGYEKTLDIVGVGYRVQKKGSDLEFSLGYSHPILFKSVKGIELDVDGQNKVIVRGIDKCLVGQMAANIRKLRAPEPYKGKGIRYTGEIVKKKAGKTGKSSK